MNAISTPPPSMRLSAWLRCLMRVAMALEDIHGVVLSVQQHQQSMLLQGLYEHLLMMTGERLRYVDERQPLATLFAAYDAELARLCSRPPSAEFHPLRLVGLALPKDVRDDATFNAEWTGDLIARTMVVHVASIDDVPRPASGISRSPSFRLSENGLNVLAKAFFAGMIPAVLAMLKRINLRSGEFNQLEAVEAAAQPIFSMGFVEEKYQMPRRPMTH